MGSLLFPQNILKKIVFFETSGRYSHSKNYIEELCDEFGFHLSHFAEAKLRKEKGVFLTAGLYFLDF
jgi:predicted TPR repeat methyltransferase